jgi:putative flippase GtrA
MLDRQGATQFLIYLAGGVLCALVDIGVMQLMVRSGTAYQLATSAGFASGLLLNYAYHARLTFRSKASSTNFLRYMCVVAANYLLTLACVAAAVALLDIKVATSSLIGKVVSLPIIAINGYLLGKYWIFKPAS